MEGEKNALLRQHGDLRNDYAQGHEEVKDSDIIKSLYEINPDKF